MDTLINPEIRVQNPGHFWLRQQKFERSRVLRVGGAMRSIVVLCTVVEHVKKLKMQEWKCGNMREMQENAASNCRGGIAEVENVTSNCRDKKCRGGKCGTKLRGGIARVDNAGADHEGGICRSGKRLFYCMRYWISGRQCYN